MTTEPLWLQQSKGRPAMGASIIQDTDTSKMELHFGSAEKGIKVAPISKLDHVSLAEIQVWCVKNAVYQVPTTELIQWLRPHIVGKRAIEICAGHGVIGRSFQIPTTDSHMQKRPEIRAHYEMLGQAITEPPEDVEKLEAMEAVRKYEPEVVIASWATQLWKSKADKNASMYGVDEEALLDFPSVKTYIHIGNEGSHGDKRILRRPHKKEKLPFLVARTQHQVGNIVYTWNVG